MAQLGARINGIDEVTGSIPVWSTKFLPLIETIQQVAEILVERRPTAAGARILVRRDGAACPLVSMARVWGAGLGGRAGRAREPLAQLGRRFDRGGAVERHQRGGCTGATQDLGPPSSAIHGRDFDDVAATVDGLFEPNCFHAAISVGYRAM